MSSRMVQVPGGTPSGRYQAPTMRLGRSQFDLSHNHSTTFEVGQLIPYFVAEVVPGDTQTCKLTAFARIFSPLDAPIMDNIEMSIEFFFVPKRLIWSNWQAFLGEHDQAGAQDTEFTIPVLASGTTITTGMFGTYFGIPIGLDTTQVEVSALPFRGFRLIYNEWYRDQNLIDEVSINLGNGPDSTAQSGVALGGSALRSAKKHDYFTSALPYLQKGDPSSVLLSGTLPVTADTTRGSEAVGVYSTPATAGYYRLDTSSLAGQVAVGTTSDAAEDSLYVDLGDAAGFTINALREAAAIQRLLERDARAGTRYTEIVRSHFGVDVPDYRVQRPEYLGGGRGYINITPVAQTSTEGATENVGTLYGVGTGTLRASWAKSFVEHGYVYGILRARGELSYSQGLDRMWSRSTKYDFLWPELAHLGEQAILNKELFVSNSPATDDAVFGYQERYAEYRFKKSLVTGKFAPDATGSLSYWHLSEDFASLPSLNQTFIEDQTPMSRVQAVTTEPDFIIDGRFDYKVARALPVRPVPTLAPARF